MKRFQRDKVGAVPQAGFCSEGAVAYPDAASSRRMPCRTGISGGPSSRRVGLSRPLLGSIVGSKIEAKLAAASSTRGCRQRSRWAAGDRRSEFGKSTAYNSDASIDRSIFDPCLDHPLYGLPVLHAFGIGPLCGCVTPQRSRRSLNSGWKAENISACI